MLHTRSVSNRFLVWACNILAFAIQALALLRQRAVVKCHSVGHMIVHLDAM